MQKFPVNKSAGSHAGFKTQWAQQQKEKFGLVAKWRTMVLGSRWQTQESKGRAAAIAKALRTAKERAPIKASAQGKATANHRHAA